MFNLYTYEKQLLEEYKKNFEEKCQKNLKLKRQKELNNLSQNYDNRMKNFIFSMCEKPIILRKKPNENILNQTFNNKKFIFGEYKSERQRLKEIELNKNKLNEYEEERKKIEKKKMILKIKNNRDLLLIQPEMRFTSRTNLEKIIDAIKKEDVFNKDLNEISLLEKIQKNKFKKEKKIKEFYNLIDKEYLNDKDIQETIKYMKDIEQDELNNKYTFKNHLFWKYYGIIANNDTSKMGNKSLNKKNTQHFLKNMVKEDNKNPLKNEFEALAINNIKTHFKGSSQFVEFLELQNNNRSSTVRNNLKKQINFSSLNMAIISLLKEKNKSKSLKKENLEKVNLEKFKAKTSRNINKVKKILNKRLVPVQNIYLKYQNDKNFNKNDYSINDLSNVFKKKKIIMNNLLKKEIDKSISKEFMKKYNSMNFFGEIVNIPKEYDFEVDDNLSEIKKEKNLEEKRKLLVELIIEEKRKENNIKYKEFVKRFQKSIFGNAKRKWIRKLDDIKIENKIDYIVIDGKPYLKKDIRKIRDIIFRKCNYYNTKKNCTI